MGETLGMAGSVSKAAAHSYLITRGSRTFYFPTVALREKPSKKRELKFLLIEKFWCNSSNRISPDSWERFPG